MTWTSILFAVAVVAAMLLFVRTRQISKKAAVEYLRNGAVVIDVRSAGEFTAGHLPKAINIPLSEIETVIARKVKDKNQVLLLHCQSGSRSVEAMRRLKAVGYENSYNLGSYGRAAQIVGSRID
ncbi:MAG TPA: rhodanese-like domain-containing protein [Terracidiphilus sp.]|nr:rhodanese-like domain-containing protein [Terracidiphilus sp.]